MTRAGDSQSIAESSVELLSGESIAILPRWWPSGRRNAVRLAPGIPHLDGKPMFVRSEIKQVASTEGWKTYEQKAIAVCGCGATRSCVGLAPELTVIIRGIEWVGWICDQHVVTRIQRAHETHILQMPALELFTDGQLEAELQRRKKGRDDGRPDEEAPDPQREG